MLLIMILSIQIVLCFFLSIYFAMTIHEIVSRYVIATLLYDLVVIITTSDGSRSSCGGTGGCDLFLSDLFKRSDLDFDIAIACFSALYTIIIYIYIKRCMLEMVQQFFLVSLAPSLWIHHCYNLPVGCYKPCGSFHGDSRGTHSSKNASELSAAVWASWSVMYLTW